MVRLDDKGKLRWAGQGDGAPEVWTKDPETGIWTRVIVFFMRNLPIKG